MKHKHSAVVFVALLVNSVASAQPTAVAPAPTADYDILVYKTKTGSDLYGLVCDSGTTECNYIWAQLCQNGEAKNSDPWGEMIDAPGYSRDKKGRPVRLFVCK